MIWCNLKRFRGTKSENWNNRCEQILFTALLVMRIDMDVNMGPASVSAHSLRCWRNSLAEHPPTTGHETLS